MKIVKTIVFGLFALMFINAGLDKFLDYMPKPQMEGEMQEVFEAFVALKWIMPLTGIAEVLAGVLILWPKSRALGAVVAFPVLIGIIAHNMTFMPEGLIIAGVLLLIDLWIIADNWNKYKPMIA